ncbi:MAG: nucleotide-diphospho-sugar transferase [Alphaproteobacteria bacterium]|nr:nucleotide-diphospho-sugar transferase [Alphaproteobacteria bacterium]
MKTPVLFLIFNRLDYTKQSFEQIRTAKPARLYIAADGPRADKIGEDKIVREVRDWVLNNIDWKCKVSTLFRDKNLGCGRAISEAITWFFKNEECGIILEDDIVPSQSFFSFCEEALERYKDNKKVWTVSGCQFDSGLDKEQDYGFSRFFMCWGWATWRDRWSKFDWHLNWDEKFIDKFTDDKNIRLGLKTIFRRHKKGCNTWAWKMQFLVMKNNGLNVQPAYNLVTNIGADGRGYHNDFNNPDIGLKRTEMPKKWGGVRHPPKVAENPEFSRYQLYAHAHSPYNKGRRRRPIGNAVDWIVKFLFG